jgi:serine/threonine protein kinase
MHRPPLHCKNDKYIDEQNPLKDKPLPGSDFYDNRVSKLMAIEDATKEQSENAQMDRKDPNGLYHYIQPIRCRTDTSSATKRRIEQCKLMGNSILKDTDSYNSYQLLLMEDGGNNLNQFVKSLDPTNVSGSKDRLFHFWHQVPSLLRGLQRMQEGHDDQARLVHLDIKPENIVYNERNVHHPKLALIDFGLMHSFAEIKEKTTRNKFDYATFHWNFAPELYYYNQATFQSVGNANDTQYNEYIHRFEDAVKHNKQRTRNDREQQDQQPYLFKKYNESVYHFIRNMVPDATNDIITHHSMIVLNSFKEMLSYIHENPANEQYSAFLAQAIPQIDAYGMGLSLAYVLSYTGSMFIQPEGNSTGGEEFAFVKKIVNIFKRMVTPNVLARIDIGTALSEYEDILRTDPACTKWSREHPSPAQASSSSMKPKSPQSPSPIYWRSKSVRNATPKSKRIVAPSVPDRPKRKRSPRTEKFTGIGGGRRRYRRTHRK